MSSGGWIKLHRKLRDSQYGKNLELVGLFANLLLMVNHKDGFVADGTRVMAGQVMTSKIGLSKEFKITEMRCHRLLKKLESAGYIAVHSSQKNSIITVLNWGTYQMTDGLIADQVRTKRGTNAEQVRTNKNAKNEKNEKNKYIMGGLDLPDIAESIDASPAEALTPSVVISALNEICGTKYRNTPSHGLLIQARINEGFTLTDFWDVITHKNSEWSRDPKMAQYLRPQTLFTGRFDGYLQEARRKEGVAQQKEALGAEMLSVLSGGAA